MIGTPGIFKSQTYPHWASGSLPVAAQLSLHWLKEAVILCAQLSLPPTRGERFALLPHDSDGSKKGCWFFSQFNFLLVVRVEWQFPSSSHAGQGPWKSLVLQSLHFLRIVFISRSSTPLEALPGIHMFLCPFQLSLHFLSCLSFIYNLLLLSFSSTQVFFFSTHLISEFIIYAIRS